MTRILIADDHDVVRSGVRAILEGHEGWEVVGEARDGKEAIDRALATRPDVVVLDYALPLVNGVEATRQIRGRVPGIEVLIFTMHDTDGLIRDVLEAGARGFLLKSDAKQFLISAVESLAAHKPFFTGKVSETLLETYLAKGSAGKSALSSREKAVVQLIAEGKTNKQIADILSISTKTVETHRALALRKLNLDTTAALIRYAIRLPDGGGCDRGDDARCAERVGPRTRHDRRARVRQRPPGCGRARIRRDMPDIGLRARIVANSATRAKARSAPPRSSDGPAIFLRARHRRWSPSWTSSRQRLGRVFSLRISGASGSCHIGSGSAQLFHMAAERLSRPGIDDRDGR